MFKVIWYTSKQCYVVASKLATKTNDKKKLLVAAVLTALAMGGPLQVGAETTVTADKINAIDIEASNIKLENSGTETKIYGSEISLVADDISGIPWKTVLNAGLMGIETSEVNTLIGRHGVYVSGVDDTRETIIEPKGMTIANKAGDVLEFNFDKISAGNMKIQDVAEATADTDAVNYKQLKSYVAEKGNSRIPTLSQQGVNTNVLIGANPDGSTNYTVSVNPELVNLTSAEFGLDTDPKRSIVNTEKSQFFDGDVNTAVRANGVKLENTNNLDIAEYTMDGMMADSNGKHVRFGTQGIDAGDQVIAGVKAGVADSDVVTVKQLKDSISNVGANELKQAINSVATETQRVGAHAAAMAALKPIQYDPLEPTQVMAGVGNYRGETAAALGLAHYTNENTMLNVGVSLGSHNMVNAGVTHKFGYSPEKKNIPDRYKGGPISSIYVMQDEMTRMQAKNDAQQVELEQQRTEIESLKSMVQQLLEKH
jgi:hemagglutinin superfamily